MHGMSFTIVILQLVALEVYILRLLALGVDIYILREPIHNTAAGLCYFLFLLFLIS